MIDCEERGDGPAVTFLHGFALDWRMWAPQTRSLVATHRTLAVDLPGFGPGGERFTGEACGAEAVAELLDSRGVRETHLVGHSFGGAVAVDFALAYPGRVLSLTLVDALLLGRPAGIAAWGACCELARDGLLAEARRAWVDDALFAAARANTEVRPRLEAMTADYACGHWAGRLSARWVEEGPAARLGEIRVPAIVVSGELDTPSFLAMSAEFTAKLPRARALTIRGAGHMASLEAPEAFYDGVRALFD